LMAVEPGTGVATPRVSNAVVQADGDYLVTIGRESVAIPAGTYVVLNTGELMLIEDAAGMGLTIATTELTPAQQQRVANIATSSGANPSTASGHDSGIPDAPSSGGTSSTGVLEQSANQ